MPSIWISSSLTNPPVTIPSSGARIALPVSGSIPALEIKLDKSSKSEKFSPKIPAATNF